MSSGVQVIWPPIIFVIIVFIYPIDYIATAFAILMHSPSNTIYFPTMEAILIIMVIVMVGTLLIIISIVECIVHDHYGVGRGMDSFIDIAKIRYISCVLYCYIDDELRRP